MLGYVIGPGPQGGSMSVSASGKITETVPDQYSVVGFSADGGLTWTVRHAARQRSRAETWTPWPARRRASATRPAGRPSRSGSATPTTAARRSSLVTRDAGRTWQRVSFAVPAQVPSGMQGDSFMDIGQIQCPQADACVAIGISDQGSTSTPDLHESRLGGCGRLPAR